MTSREVEWFVRHGWTSVPKPTFISTPGGNNLTSTNVDVLQTIFVPLELASTSAAAKTAL